MCRLCTVSDVDHSDADKNVGYTSTDSSCPLFLEDNVAKNIVEMDTRKGRKREKKAE